jgi:DNA polymerase III subunit epsilon
LGFGGGADSAQGPSGPQNRAKKIGPRPYPLPQRLTEAEIAAHARLVAELGNSALWLKQSPYQQ